MKDLSAAQTITCHMNCKWNVNRQNASTKREAYFFQSLTSSHQKAFYSLFRQKVTILEEKVTKLSSFFGKEKNESFLKIPLPSLVPTSTYPI